MEFHGKKPLNLLRRAGLLVSVWLLATPAMAGLIIIEPEVHWIGPEMQCDYTSIQEALDDIFDCGLLVCPLGTHELRLSDGYNHDGSVLVRRSFDIRGGFAACQAPFDGGNKLLAPARADEPLFVVRPGAGTIRNEFRDLQMAGGFDTTPLGGVITMEAGNATLRLEGSIVTQGKATLGGGIHMAGAGNRLEISSSIIEANQASEGGGIFCTGGGEIDFESGRVQANVAELSGGGIYLQANCKLFGKSSGKDRHIVQNIVTDSQRGQGAGIFAIASRIEVGALNSRTRIEQNAVSTQPAHDYQNPGDNRGGGIHLDSASATFYNTWFRGNEAADGGAISAIGNTDLLVDRFSGPCDPGDTGNTPDCSLFEFNRALGGIRFGDEGGDGAVLVTAFAFGVEPRVSINRSLIRTNTANCLGEVCDTDLASSSSIVKGASVGVSLVGNLFYDNRVRDNDWSHFFRLVEVFNDNTVAANESVDAVFSFQGPGELVNNVIWEQSTPAGTRVDSDFFELEEISSCNITNFADEFDLEAASSPVRGVNQDPLFINPIASSPDADFGVAVPDSPAIDRCDDEGGRLTLTYDIVGNPRPTNIPATSNGSGQRDAGAFEALPAGTQNVTTDLVVAIASATPKTAELLEPHQFTIVVSNNGRNSPQAFSVALDFPLAEATLETLIGADNAITGEPRWSCDVANARCDSLSGLAPGGTTTTITAAISFANSGLKTVLAEALMEDMSLVELTPDDNTRSDIVTVGLGADLGVFLNAGSPGEGPVGATQDFFLAVVNNGPDAAPGVAVALDFSSGQLELLDGTGWDCTVATSICVRTAQLDALVDTGFIVATLRYPVAGTHSLAATVSALDSTPDPNPNNNVDTDAVQVLETIDEMFADSFEN